LILPGNQLVHNAQPQSSGSSFFHLAERIALSRRPAAEQRSVLFILPSEWLFHNAQPQRSGSSFFIILRAKSSLTTPSHRAALAFHRAWQPARSQRPAAALQLAALHD
jgi:hypothetical protein